MIDSHAHIISEFYDNIDETIKLIKKNGVIHVFNCADSINTSLEVIELFKKYGNILLPVIGIHPENINNFNILDLEKLLKQNKVLAIGEIGLDYHYSKENKSDQIKYFSLQLDLAEKYNLPVIIHTRDSIQDCYDVIKDRNIKGIIHCFSGSYEMADKFIKKGFLLGIGGVLTFKNSNLYKVIEKIDIQYIVLETDSPFLSPEPFRGKINYPSNIFYVAKKIAEIKNLNIDDVFYQNIINLSKIFDFK